MAYEDFKDKSDLEIISQTWGQAVTNPGAVSVDRLLKLRHQNGRLRPPTRWFSRRIGSSERPRTS